MHLTSFTMLAGNEYVSLIARAVTSIEGCQVKAVCSASQSIDAIFRKEFPNVVSESDPIALVTRHVNSALILSGWSDEELAAARHFLEISDQPLIVVTDAEQGPARLFELMSAWQDAPGRIQPVYIPGGDELLAKIQALSLQAPARLHVTRSVQRDTLRLTQTEVDRWLFQDLYWITQIVEEFRDVTTFETGTVNDSVEETTIKLTNDDDIEITWSIRTGPANELRAELRTDEGVRVQHTCEVSQDRLIQELKKQLQQISQGQQEAIDDPWQRVIRLGQMGATARRSATRRRTLSIYHEDATERSQFKSQMAAVGCFVLLWTMFGVIGLMTFGAVVDPRDREMKTSSSAGFVLNQTEFDGEDLSPAGEIHLREIARHWSEASPVLLIESETAELDNARKAEVMDSFEEWDVQVDPNRVVTRELNGHWFESVMWLGWGVVFFPLVAVILAQGFILLTQ